MNEIQTKAEHDIAIATEAIKSVSEKCRIFGEQVVKAFADAFQNFGILYGNPRRERYLLRYRRRGERMKRRK